MKCAQSLNGMISSNGQCHVAMGAFAIVKRHKPKISKVKNICYFDFKSMTIGVMSGKPTRNLDLAIHGSIVTDSEGMMK
jgi:hypothetical protein